MIVLIETAQQIVRKSYPIAYSEQLLSDGSWRVWNGNWRFPMGIGVIGEGRTELEAWSNVLENEDDSNNFFNHFKSI